MRSTTTDTWLANYAGPQNALAQGLSDYLQTGDNRAKDLAAGVFALMCIRPDTTGLAVDHKLVDLCRQQGVSDLDFARFWMINLGDFGGPNFHKSNEYVGELNHIMSPQQYFSVPEAFVAQNAYEELLLGLNDDDALKLLQHHEHAAIASGPYQGLLAHDRPDVLKRFLETLDPDNSRGAVDWQFVTGASDAFDTECIESCQRNGDTTALIILNALRGGIHSELTTTQCMAMPSNRCNAALFFLADNAPELMVEKLADCYASENFTGINVEQIHRYCRIAAERWEQGGERVFKNFKPEQLASRKEFPLREHFRHALIEGAAHSATKYPAIREWLMDVANLCPKPDYPWDRIARISPAAIETELWEMFRDKRKTARAVAITGLTHESMSDPIELVKECLSGKDSNAKLGAIEFLSTIATDESIQVLRLAAADKHPAKVSQALNNALEELGATPPLEEALEDAAKSSDSQTILAGIEKKRAPKLPKSADWLGISTLPELLTHDGIALSEKAIATLCLAQARHKSITAAPDNIPLLSLIDRKKSGDFAVEILKQWLRSNQETASRWGLAVAGLLGDQRVLPLLTDPIPNFGKRPDYATGTGFGQTTKLADTTMESTV